MLNTIRSSMFKEAKVAQMAAYFLSQQDEPMHVLKLMKLLYLSDRKSMENTGFPMTFDRMVSMPFGPVLSETLGYINGTQSASSDWETWVSDRANHKVSLNRPFNDVTELGKLSSADIKLMDNIWSQFKYMDRFEISDYTHNGNCSEWKDPDGSSFPIQYKDVFLALGSTDSEAEELGEQIEQQKLLEDIFSKA